MNRNVILIGFMGAGKTSVGQCYAGRLGLRLTDTDELIEETAGMKISEIFRQQGEESFRVLETQMLERLLEDGEPKIISTGGGLPLREENRAVLKKLGTVVYLQVQPETVLRRLEGDDTRPLLQGEDVEGKVRHLLGERDRLYRLAADVMVPTDGKSLDEIVEEIEGRVRQDETAGIERP